MGNSSAALRGRPAKNITKHVKTFRNGHLCFRVERSSKVGRIELRHRLADRVLVVVGVNAARRPIREVDSTLVGEIGESESTQNVGTCANNNSTMGAKKMRRDGACRARHSRVPNGLDLMFFTPVDVWSAGASGRVDDVCGLDFIELSEVLGVMCDYRWRKKKRVGLVAPRDVLPVFQTCFGENDVETT